MRSSAASATVCVSSYYYMCVVYEQPEVPSRAIGLEGGHIRLPQCSCGVCVFVCVCVCVCVWPSATSV